MASEGCTPKASWPEPYGHGLFNAQIVAPGEHPKTTQKGPKMGGELTYQPKWDPIGFEPWPYVAVARC